MTVPRSTLTAVPDSMFASMFSCRHKLRTDADDRVFIDRCACVDTPGALLERGVPKH